MEKQAFSQIWATIFFLIIITSISTILFLYTRTWDPLWNPFRPEPNEVIAIMTDEIRNISAFHSDSRIELSIENKEKDYFLGGEIALDCSNFDSGESKKAVFDLEFEEEKRTIHLKGEVININDIFYIKFRVLPFFLLGSSLKSDEWVQVNEDEIKKLSQSLDIEIKKLELIQGIKKILSNKNLYNIIEELPDEKISSDVKTYHYLITFDLSEIEELISETSNILEKTKESYRIIEELKEMRGEIWIRKDDNLPWRLKLEKEIEEDNEEGIAVKLDVFFADFNQPKEINEPGEYKSLKEVLAPPAPYFIIYPQDGDTISTISPEIAFYPVQNADHYKASIWEGSNAVLTDDPVTWVTILDSGKTDLGPVGEFRWNQSYTFAIKSCIEEPFYLCSDWGEPIRFTIKPEGRSCMDSDGGKNYYKKGKATVGLGEMPDSCLYEVRFSTEDRDTLIEYYCTGDMNNPVKQYLYECPYGCESGACVSKPSIGVFDIERGGNLEAGKTYYIRWNNRTIDRVNLAIIAYEVVGNSYWYKSYPGSSNGYIIAQNINGRAGEFKWTVPDNDDYFQKYHCYRMKLSYLEGGKEKVIEESDRCFDIRISEKKPDLIITKSTWTPHRPKPGDMINFVIRVHNFGNSVSSDATITLSDEYDWNRKEIISSIAPQQSEEVTISFEAEEKHVTRSPNKLTITVTPFDSIDLNFDNNSKKVDFYVFDSSIQLDLLSPNGGEEWVVGETYDITWEAKGIEKVYIEGKYSGGGYGGGFNINSGGIPSSEGKYSWTIPSSVQLGKDCYRITLRDSLKSYLFSDTSENCFKIISSE